MVSTYDRVNIKEILRENLGDWFTAHTLRYLEQILFKADQDNGAKIHRAFPEECVLIYQYNNWTNEAIRRRFDSYGLVGVILD